MRSCGEPMVDGATEAWLRSSTTPAAAFVVGVVRCAGLRLLRVPGALPADGVGYRDRRGEHI